MGGVLHSFHKPVNPLDFNMPRDVDNSELYPADLRNPKTFTPYNECPADDDDINRRFFRASRVHGTKEPSLHWCFLGEVVEDLTLYLPRIVLGVRDKAGKYLRVAFYFDKGVTFDYSRVRVGNVIAVLYAEQHFFLDGSHGLRLEEPSYVKVCATGLMHLFDSTHPWNAVFPM